MRRIKLVLAALAVMVAMFAAFAAPAMAADNVDCRNVPGPDVRCDGTYYAPVDNGGYNYWYYPYSYGYTNYWNPYWYGYYPYYSGGDNIFEVIE